MSLSAAQAANAQNREALIVCRLFPAACTTHLETRLNWATAAAGKLVAGVGWSQLVGLALCVAIGLRARRATASRPVRSRLAQYWLGGPRPANAFLAFKLFLAALLYLEWLGLTAPEQDILATPEWRAPRPAAAVPTRRDLLRHSAPRKESRERRFRGVFRGVTIALVKTNAVKHFQSAGAQKIRRFLVSYRPLGIKLDRRRAACCGTDAAIALHERTHESQLYRSVRACSEHH